MGSPPDRPWKAEFSRGRPASLSHPDRQARRHEHENETGENADSGDDEGLGPGRTTNPKRWDALWAQQEGALEAPSRAMIGRVRHDKASRGALCLADCRELLVRQGGRRYRSSEVLLIATCSRRVCGLRRFKVLRGADRDEGIWIGAEPRDTPTGAAKTADRDPLASDKRAALKALDTELDRWQGRAVTTDAADIAPWKWGSHSGNQDRRGLPVMQELKRPRGTRGNPNRPSQLKKQRPR